MTELSNKQKHLLSDIGKYRNLLKEVATSIEDYVYSYSSKIIPESEWLHIDTSWLKLLSQKEREWIRYNFLPALEFDKATKRVITAIKKANAVLFDLTEADDFKKFLNNKKESENQIDLLFDAAYALTSWELDKEIEQTKRDIIFGGVKLKGNGSNNDNPKAKVSEKANIEEMNLKEKLENLSSNILSYRNVASGLTNTWKISDTIGSPKERNNREYNKFYNEARQIFKEAVERGIILSAVPAGCDSLKDFQVLQSWLDDSLCKISLPQEQDNDKYYDKLIQIAKETEKILNSDWNKIRLPLIDKAARFLINEHLKKEQRHLEVFGNISKLTDFHNNLNSLANEKLSFSNNDIGKFCAALFLAYDYAVSPQLYEQIKANALGICNLTLEPKPPLFEDYLRTGDNPIQNTKELFINRLNDYLSYIIAYLKAENLLKDESKDTGTNKQDNMTDKKQNITDIKSRFTIEDSRILFDKRDLYLPTGRTIEIAKTLIENFDKVVRYKFLDSESTEKDASDNLRTYKSNFSKALKKLKIACKIITKKQAGYILTAK